MTVRELLGHGGGVVRNGRDADFWQLIDRFPDRDELVAMSVAGGGVIKRNVRFKYSNVGYGVLGLIVEVVSGASYADYVAEHLLRPLGLEATSVEFDAEVDLAADHAAPMATGHSTLVAGRRLPIDHITTGALDAATGFVSRASDVVRWAAAHFDGDDRLLDADAQRVMQRTEYSVAGSGGTEYALGFGVTTVNGRRLLGHGGGFPGHITHTLFDPVAGIAVSVLTNCLGGPAQMYAANFFRLLDLAERHADPAEAATDDGDDATGPDLSSYTGRFCGRLWGRFDIVELGGRLYQLDVAAGDPAADAVRLDVVDADTLVVCDAPGYHAEAEPVSYTRAADGSIAAVRIQGVTARPSDVVVAELSGLDRITLDAAPSVVD